MEGDSTVEVRFSGKSYMLPKGSNLRRALLNAGAPLYNGAASALNCRGLGSCGTCAIRILEGEFAPAVGIERWRLSFPPHKPESGLRLACQLKVIGEMSLEKAEGFWGQGRDL